MQGQENLPYTKSVKKLNLFSLSKRRVRDALITMYKLLTQGEISNAKGFFNIADKGVK